MKNLIKTATILGILVTGSLTAQSFVDKTEIVKVTIFENDSDEITSIKTIVKEQQPNIFETEDEFKLNQDLAKTPIYVDKTVLVDLDSDPAYDKKARFNYIKDERNEAYYTITDDVVSDLEIGDTTMDDIILLEDVDIIE